MQTHSSGNWVDRTSVEEHLRTTYSELVDVDVRNVVGRYTLKTPEEWVLAFGSMLSWVTGTWWSEETRVAHPIEEVKRLTIEHLENRYGGREWEVSWELVIATGRKRL